MKHVIVPAIALSLAVTVPVDAQQKPATAAEKAAAEKAADEKAMKDARDAMPKMAAEMAEAVARAQQKVAEDAEKARREADLAAGLKRSIIITLDIEVVISRYQGDKKVSSLPFALTVNAPSWTSKLEDAPLTQLRMGGQVPLPTMAPVMGPDGKPLTGLPTGGGPVLYKDIGTYIDARGRWLEGQPGAFEVWISVQEDAVATPQGAPAAALPVIRTFRASNNMVLRGDGQTRQFTAAADRITGEVVKVDVTLKVAK